MIARLEAVHGEVYQLEGTARSLVQTGREIRSGQGLETGEDSTAVLAFADGTRLQLGANTVLAELTDGAERGKRVDLVEGSVLADVARQEPDRPMLLTTPRAELTFQGTKFLVASEPSATHLELEQGQVRLVRRDDQQAIEVEAGFYAVVPADAEPLLQRPLPPRVRTPRLSLQGRFTSLAFSPDGQTFATGSNGHVDLWDPGSGEQRTSHSWNGEWVHALAYSPDGKTLAMGGKNSRGARLWQVGTGQFVQLGGGGMIHRLAFSPDGRTLALSRAQRSFQLWDAVQLVERWSLSGHADTVTGLAFGPDNQTLVSGSEDGTVKVWDVVGGRELATLAAATGSEKSRKANRVLAVAFSPDGKTVAAGFPNGTIQLWDLAAQAAAREPAAARRPHHGAGLRARRQTAGLRQQGPHGQAVGPGRRRRGGHLARPRRRDCRCGLFPRRQDPWLHRQGPEGKPVEREGRCETVGRPVVVHQGASMSTRQSMSLFLGMILLLLSPRSALGHLHPGICVTKSGTIVVVHYEEKTAEKKGKVLICRSTDGGKSWSPSFSIPGVKEYAYPGAITALSDGRIVVTWSNFGRQDGEGPSPRRPLFCISSDDGKTWSEPRGIPTNPDNYLSLTRSRETDGWLRHSILELGPNDWLIPAANKTVVYHVKTGDVTTWGGGSHGGVPIVRSAKGTFVSGAGRRSTDQGKTWQQIKPFPQMDYGSDLIALSNGYLVAARDINDKMGMQLIVSRDDGATWDLDGALAIYHPERQRTETFGRPHLAQIDPDTLGVVFWDHGTPPPGSGAILVAVGERGTKVCFLRVPLMKLQARSGE